jgi:hypothetical protein
LSKELRKIGYWTAKQFLQFYTKTKIAIKNKNKKGLSTSEINKKCWLH